jgi:subtilisin
MSGQRKESKGPSMGISVVTTRQTARLAHASNGDPLHSSRLALPSPLTREWAWGTSTGSGVRVCLIDSGVDAGHAVMGGRVTALTVAAELNEAGERAFRVVPDAVGDAAGHGTACAGIILSLAPCCEITSLRILGPKLHGEGDVLLAGLEWAIEQRFPLVNLSMSTRREAYKEALHDIADRAYFSGVTIVAAAHNRPVRSYPWQFSSVISVGSHELADAEHLEANPAPPVEFFARGVGVDVPRPGGGCSRVSGNSFATPHITGMCARTLGNHPAFGTGQLKHVLAAIANNKI